MSFAKTLHSGTSAKLLLAAGMLLGEVSAGDGLIGKIGKEQEREKCTEKDHKEALKRHNEQPWFAKATGGHAGDMRTSLVHVDRTGDEEKITFYSSPLCWKCKIRTPLAVLFLTVTVKELIFDEFQWVGEWFDSDHKRGTEMGQYMVRSMIASLFREYGRPLMKIAPKTIQGMLIRDVKKNGEERNWFQKNFIFPGENELVVNAVDKREPEFEIMMNAQGMNRDDEKTTVVEGKVTMYCFKPGKTKLGGMERIYGPLQVGPHSKADAGEWEERCRQVRIRSNTDMAKHSVGKIEFEVYPREVWEEHKRTPTEEKDGSAPRNGKESQPETTDGGMSPALKYSLIALLVSLILSAVAYFMGWLDVKGKPNPKAKDQPEGDKDDQTEDDKTEHAPEIV